MNKKLLVPIIIAGVLVGSCTKEQSSVCPASPYKLTSMQIKLSVLSKAEEHITSFNGKKITVNLLRFPGELYPVGNPDSLHNISGRIGEKFNLDFRNLEKSVVSKIIYEKGVKAIPSNSEIMRVGTIAIPEGSGPNMYEYGHGFYDAAIKKLFMIVYFDRKAKLDGKVTRGKETRNIRISIGEPGFYAIAPDDNSNTDCAFTPSSDVHFALIGAR